MSLWDLAQNPLPANLGVLAIVALVIWFAGSRLSEYADEIARRTNLSKAFIGLLLLAFVTSLPEVATTLTASLTGNASLAIGNLFGGIAMQTAILSMTDLLVVRGALTFFTPRPVLLLQGVMLVALLGLTLAASTTGDVSLLPGLGVWPIVLVLAYVFTLQQTLAYEGNSRWQSENSNEERRTLDRRQQEIARHNEEQQRKRGGLSNTRLYGGVAVLAIVILTAGFVTARLGEAIAEQSGLGQSFVGATLVTITTSMPEVSTTIRAGQLGNYSMAIANIFGSNAFMVALLLVADGAYREGPIIEAFDRGIQLSIAVGIVVTTIYLWGLLERRDRTVFRMGLDSAAVVVAYLSGIGLLYAITS